MESYVLPSTSTSRIEPLDVILTFLPALSVTSCGSLIFITGFERTAFFTSVITSVKPLSGITINPSSNKDLYLLYDFNFNTFSINSP